MGLFDNIHFEKSPFIKTRIVDFQTKSLDNTLEEYRITKDKKLQISGYILRLPNEKEKTEYKNKKHNLPFYIKEHTNWHDTNITGSLEAYTIKNDKWYQINIQVINGKVNKMNTEIINLGENHE